VVDLRALLRAPPPPNPSSAEEGSYVVIPHGQGAFPACFGAGFMVPIACLSIVNSFLNRKRKPGLEHAYLIGGRGTTPRAQGFRERR